MARSRTFRPKPIALYRSLLYGHALATVADSKETCGRFQIYNLVS